MNFKQYLCKLFWHRLFFIRICDQDDYFKIVAIQITCKNCGYERRFEVKDNELKAVHSIVNSKFK